MKKVLKVSKSTYSNANFDIIKGTRCSFSAKAEFANSDNDLFNSNVHFKSMQKGIYLSDFKNIAQVNYLHMS